MDKSISNDNSVEHVVDVKMIQWRHIPDFQKKLMIGEFVMNARTTQALNLGHKLKLHHFQEHKNNETSNKRVS